MGVTDRLLPYGDHPLAVTTRGPARPFESVAACQDCGWSFAAQGRVLSEARDAAVEAFRRAVPPSCADARALRLVRRVMSS